MPFVWFLAVLPQARHRADNSNRQSGTRNGAGRTDCEFLCMKHGWLISVSPSRWNDAENDTFVGQHAQKPLFHSRVQSGLVIVSYALSSRPQFVTVRFNSNSNPIQFLLLMSKQYFRSRWLTAMTSQRKKKNEQKIDKLVFQRQTGACGTVRWAPPQWIHHFPTKKKMAPSLILITWQNTTTENEIDKQILLFWWKPLRTWDNMSRFTGENVARQIFERTDSRPSSVLIDSFRKFIFIIWSSVGRLRLAEGTIHPSWNCCAGNKGQRKPIERNRKGKKP